MKQVEVYCLFAFLWRATCICALNIEEGSVSTSGVSAGAAMATQVHVAFSSQIMGCATFAGSGPYYCAQDSLTFALGRCMTAPANIPLDNLIEETEAFASAGDIDSTSNIEGSKVFIWHGAMDETVVCGASLPIRDYYENYGAEVFVPCFNKFAAGHCQPVANGAGGVANDDCSSTASPYINNCGYDGAFHALNQIYGDNLVAPDRENPSDLTGQLMSFDQGDYVQNPGGISLLDTGYIYVPQACANDEPCKLHIAFHGCIMDYDTIDDDYVLHGGYNQVADLNNIVIVYPQAKRSLTIPYNPNGCFDWWGYTDGVQSTYATKNGAQMQFVKDLIEGVVSSQIKMKIAPQK